MDDPVDASAVHFFCGAWGLLAVGFFATEVRPRTCGMRCSSGSMLTVASARAALSAAPPSLSAPYPCPRVPQTSVKNVYGYANDWGVIYGGSGRQLGMQVLGTVVIAAWSCALAAALFLTLKKVGRAFAVASSWQRSAGPRWPCAVQQHRRRQQAGAPQLPAAHTAELCCTSAHPACPVPPTAPPQLCWLRVPPHVEEQGLDLAQGLSTGLVGKCFGR